MTQSSQRAPQPRRPQQPHPFGVRQRRVVLPLVPLPLPALRGLIAAVLRPLPAPVGVPAQAQRAEPPQRRLDPGLVLAPVPRRAWSAGRPGCWSCRHLLIGLLENVRLARERFTGHVANDPVVTQGRVRPCESLCVSAPSESWWSQKAPRIRPLLPDYRHGRHLWVPSLERLDLDRLRAKRHDAHTRPVNRRSPCPSTLTFTVISMPSADRWFPPPSRRLHSTVSEAPTPFNGFLGILCWPCGVKLTARMPHS